MADETENGNVNVRERAKKAGWNINSWLALMVGVFSLLSPIGTGAWLTFSKSRDVVDLQVWKVDHEQLHKERQGKAEARDARLDERLKALEDRQSSTESDVKLLTQRTQANEQAVGQILASIKELTTSINEVSGDVKVMRAILQRQDASGRTEIR